MQIGIEDRILERYPGVEIGYLTARVSVKKSDPFVENLKQGLGEHLQAQGINATTFVTHPSIALWRKIYEEDFHVKAKTYRSSIEALLRRVVTGKDVWNICNVVDLYNCCSILSLLPMGGYDLKKVSGNIEIRFAKEGEPFRSLGSKETIAAQPNHVVYADDKNVICWLWNHKDSAETCIDENSEYVIFFIDSFDQIRMQDALKNLAENLEKIGCVPLESGILNKAAPQAILKEICPHGSSWPVKLLRPS
jgi:DNA/RNA-binding domain of Phe-tRNA-synthetase-like protein